MNHTEAATQITIAVLGASPTRSPEDLKQIAVDTYKAVYEAIVQAARDAPSR